ncbi:acyl-CoA dehydrogenase family protein [Salinicola sp. DM10]|uniref:acyl-CoA dehydrogenase family protein n=1 Tax=Salinicola sp. DM10 TaxID=2815721 RepID=UPI001A909C49|nr:acyl-CoA dehydrogenase family protein [Salinicola sp. DM10]MCE3026383.1 acyl-CoA dehydrogenase family protein [Salinicola sp. DM10]
MTDYAPRTELSTHRVENQPCALAADDLWASDAALRDAVAYAAPAWVGERLARLGQRLGQPDIAEWADQANRYPPTLRAFDRYGQRLDEVDYHPAYHALMTLAIEGGWHAVAWEREHDGGHQAHVAGLYLLTQAEPGFCCPLTMTHAAMPVLRHLEADTGWQQRLRGCHYDPLALPAWHKSTNTFGMAMTEKQGGSDIRRNTTRAEPIEAPGSGAWYRLSGHKWFCSAPMSDAFLTLAQTDEGLSCFLAPRFTPDGERNAIELQRLKEKCGNRANASAEIEYRGAWAQLVGEPGRGVAAILEMVQQTRLDAATAPAGMMRQALRAAHTHASGRAAFGARLVEQPLMQRLLADLALETEASLWLAMRGARAMDRAATDAHEAALARLLPALAKFWHNKRGPGFMAEAMECLGGIGYVEESPLARLYREAPVNSIWEGSGNVICLDVLRILARHPESIAALRQELAPARGGHPALDSALAELDTLLAAPAETQAAQARWLTQRMAQALQAALLLRQAPTAVAETFCATRLAAATPQYGVLPTGAPVAEILARLG